jgi:DNA repair photolyase
MKMINRYLSDAGHLRSHQWKYWLDVYNNCGFDCKYCVYRISEKMGKVTAAIPSRAAFRESLTGIKPDGILYLGPKADIYQPRDNVSQLTRGIMEELCDHRFPVFTVTRSTLIMRDLDILQQMASYGLLEVSISIASAKEVDTLEPNTPSINDRLNLIRSLKRAGVAVSVHMSPIIPNLDTAEELQTLMHRCVDAGADCIYACVLGMSSAYSDLVQKIVTAYQPELNVQAAYANADRSQEVYSADPQYIVVLMDKLRDYAEANAIPFACVHLPEYDTIERNGGIFRFKIPTVGDICRHLVRRGTKEVGWTDLAPYLSRFPAVDDIVLDAVETFWSQGQLFKNTYFHPVLGQSRVLHYERLDRLDLGITNMKVGTAEPPKVVAFQR